MINDGDVLRIIDNFTNDKIVKQIINSVNDNQKKCKKWLIDKSKRFIKNYQSPKICIAAGWYGHLASMLLDYTDQPITSFDIDEQCKTIGKKFYKNKNIKFVISDIKDFDCSSFDIVICTSCEHIEQKTINSFLSKRKNNSLVILQSNNYYKIKDHINCRDSLKDFIDDYVHHKPKYYNQLEMKEYNRYMVIF